MKLTTLLLTTSLLSPVIGFCEVLEPECTEVEMSQVNYYSVFNMPKEKKLADTYRGKIEALQSFSKKYQLKSFKILSHDVSMNSNSYIQDSLEVSVSISFEAEFDYNLLDNMREEFSLSSISSSRVLNSVCDEPQ